MDIKIKDWKDYIIKENVKDMEHLISELEANWVDADGYLILAEDDEYDYKKNFWEYYQNVFDDSILSATTDIKVSELEQYSFDENNENEIAIIMDYNPNDMETLDIRLNQQNVFPYHYRYTINIQGKWFNLTEGRHKPIIEATKKMHNKASQIKWEYKEI